MEAPEGVPDTVVGQKVVRAETWWEVGDGRLTGWFPWSGGAVKEGSRWNGHWRSTVKIPLDPKIESSDVREA